MKKLFFILSLLTVVSFLCYSQPINWKDSPEKTYVFEISSNEALKLLKSNPKDTLIRKMLHTPVASFTAKWENQPTKGHFIFANINKNKIGLNYVPVIPFQVFLFKEYGALTIQVVDSTGNVSEKAKVKINRTSIDFDKESRTYTYEDYWSDEPVRILTVELDKFKAYFDLHKYPVPSWYGGSNGSSYSPDFYSYMITDKDKYKPGETVRFKSYALSGSKRPIKDDLELWLNPPRSDTYSGYKKLTTVSPYHPGGFAGEFQLHDSLALKLDKSYSIQLRDKKQRIVASASFKYEDYELFDNNLQIKLETREQFYPNTNKIEIKALDANGLFLKDMKAAITLKRKTVLNSYTNLLQLPDTLLYQVIDLDNAAPTVFEIPSTIFGKSDCGYDVEVVALTFENQRMECRDQAAFYYSHHNIVQSVKNDSLICFSFYELGKEMPVKAILSYNGSKEVKEIQLPYQEKLNQSLFSYTIRVPEPEYEKSFFTAQMNPELELTGGIEKDSFNVSLKNPLRLDLSWYVYQGNQLLQKGSGKDLDFHSGNINTEVLYYVEVFYSMGGKEQVYRKTYAPETDYLSIDLDLPERVYPGQKLDASVTVKNHWGDPVSNVDLTAFAVNSLLQYTVPDLPYYGADPVTREQRANYSMQKKTYTYNLPLDYPFWNKIGQLDQITYYQFTYPWNKLFSYTVKTPDSSTQFAPYVMKDGNAVGIYVVELNDVPVYFSWTEQPKGYSFPTSGEYQKISLRLLDRSIILDSMRLEPGMKTILSLDLDHLPKGVRVISLNNKDVYNRYIFTDPENVRYRRYISRIPVESTVNPTFLEQYQTSYVIFDPCLMRYQKSVLAGPLNEGFSRYNRGIEYKHEGGFLYEFDKNVVYKYAEVVTPGYLQFSSSNNFNNLNDFYLTPKVYAQKLKECLFGQPWHPSNIFISRPNMTLNFRLPVEKDSSGVSNLLFQNCESGKMLFPDVSENNSKSYSFIPPGKYNVILLYNNGKYLKQDQVNFIANGLVDLNMNQSTLYPEDSISANWLKLRGFAAEIGTKPNPQTFQFRSAQTSGSPVDGYVTDDNGEPLVGVTVMLKNTQFGVMTDLDGYFRINVNNKYSTLEFRYLGYKTKELDVFPNTTISATLEEEYMALDEVVVVGYGAIRKSNLSGSISSVASSENSQKSSPPEKLEISEKGKSAQSAEDEATEQLYNELRLLNGLRTNFSDVGFWEPRLFTDKKGKAEFTVTFPDNITRWDAVIYAMNPKLKTGTYRKQIKSYKPLMAELKAPQFLTIGDSSYWAGNIRNYTKDSLILGNISFTSGQQQSMQKEIQFTQSYQDKLFVTAATTDSVKAQYLFTRNDGYSDGEERTIPVVPLGTEVAKGTLSFLKNGDMLNVKAAGNEEIHLDITANQLDVYMNVASYLSGYRYDCNEQLASKLIGLLSYKSYSQYYQEKFKYDKQVNSIIKRLLDNQNDKKLWSWWGRSSGTSFWMSAHVLNALRMSKDAGYNVSLNLQTIEADYTDIKQYRGAGLYDIEIINALSQWGTKQNYSKILDLLENMVKDYEIREDSIAKKTKYYHPYSFLKEKLLLMEIRQKQNLGYNSDSLKRYLKKDVLGQAYCDDGKQERYWYSDPLATTLIAYRIIRNDSNLIDLKEPMQMYIIGTKKNDWNTYRASSVIATVLPDLLGPDANREKPATVVLKGKENRELSKFPYSLQLQPGESLNLEKKDGMPLLYSLYSIKRETQAHSGEAFEISASLDSETLTAGEPVDLTVKLNVKQTGAEYVMIEVPIPASCSYASKSTYSYSGREVHREYFKEKTVIFCENLPVGTYKYTIELLPRFTGRYTLNPAKVELMYFPVINANNDMRKVQVK